MAIASTDILFKTSTTAGSAGNSNANTTPGTSLGKYISTSQITDATLNNLFTDVSGDENAASTVVDYQCVFIHNAHGSLTLQGPVVWISAETAQGVDCAIGIDTTAASAIGSASAQALQIANRQTAPSGVSFSSPTTKGTGLALSDLPNGQCRAVWVRRTSANRAALNSDSVTIRCEGDTAA